MNYLKNPILPGFYPDPSICRVGEDYYLVTSSFETCPGIPVFHSKDLANWEQLCYAMTPDNGFEMECNSFRGGVMAPTIRYHQGTFYIINMSFSQGGNFIVTADNPSGPWSIPHLLKDVPGIDASLFFDDDGSSYVVSTGNVTTPDGLKKAGIWVQAFDLNEFHTTGERHDIWTSALNNATSPEAPHIYKKDGYYYLIIAEGGTEHYHAVTVARAKQLFDWYEGNPANPIMTHRHLGLNAKIANVGHADMVELPDGSWWAVMLGSRTNSGAYKNLGRESFACPVVWEQGWPLFSSETGKIEDYYPAPACLPWSPFPSSNPRDDFDYPQLRLEWVFWGRPYRKYWRIENSALKLKCLSRPVDRPIRPMGPHAAPVTDPADDCVSTVLRRQQSFHFEAITSVSFTPAHNESAGLLIMQSGNNSFRAEIMQENGQRYVRCVEVATHAEVPPYHPAYKPDTRIVELSRYTWDSDSIILALKVNDQSHSFYYGDSEDNLQPLYLGADGRHINTEISGGMVGTCLGMFASGNGNDSTNEAAFDYFTYRDLD